MSPTTKMPSARLPDAGPGPATSAAMRSHSAPGNGVDARLVRQLVEGQDQRERQGRDEPDRRR